ncbi:MAG TPA: bis-aminopropyl spermidine synthase family protein [Gaiellaceae bacterium]|nr:bis-aminopropyl spermidine synthase family protein [Gaiellaceae bacterium]
MPLPDAVVDEVARAVGLAEGARGVEAVIAALARLEPVSVRLLGRAADLPTPIVAAVCGELRQRGVVSQERPVQFTVEGRRRFASAAAVVETSCPTCGGRGVALSPEVARLRRGLAAVSDAAPEPRVELDQCHSTPKTKLRRVLAMHAADAINGRRILLLGDDDLISIALLRFVRQFGGRIAQLVVADIDERLLEFISRELSDAPFPLECVPWDVREPRTGSFDTVVTDPPYTAAGARLFITRAVENLAGPGSQIFFSFGSRRPGVQADVQRAVVEAGLEIRSLTRDFNDYVGAGVIGGTSHLYHLIKAPPASFSTGALYTASA